MKKSIRNLDKTMRLAVSVIGFIALILTAWDTTILATTIIQIAMALMGWIAMFGASIPEIILYKKQLKS